MQFLLFTQKCNDYNFSNVQICLFSLSYVIGGFEMFFRQKYNFKNITLGTFHGHFEQFNIVYTTIDSSNNVNKPYLHLCYNGIHRFLIIL